MYLSNFEEAETPKKFTSSLGITIIKLLILYRVNNRIQLTESTSSLHNELKSTIEALIKVTEPSPFNQKERNYLLPTLEIKPRMMTSQGLSEAECPYPVHVDTQADAENCFELEGFNKVFDFLKTGLNLLFSAEQPFDNWFINAVQTRYPTKEENRELKTVL